MSTQIVEVNGVKLEIDTRQATVVTNFKIGDRVKVLVRGYGDEIKIHHGVITSFEMFKSLPTIVVCYVEQNYNGAELKMAYIHEKAEKVEIVPCNEETLPFEKASVIERLEREILRKEQEIEDIRNRMTYFSKMFGKHFEQTQ